MVTPDAGEDTDSRRNRESVARVVTQDAGEDTDSRRNRESVARVVARDGGEDTDSRRNRESVARETWSMKKDLRTPRREPRLEADEVVHVQHRRRRRAVAVRVGAPRGVLGLEADEVVHVQQ